MNDSCSCRSLVVSVLCCLGLVTCATDAVAQLERSYVRTGKRGSPLPRRSPESLTSEVQPTAASSVTRFSSFCSGRFAAPSSDNQHPKQTCSNSRPPAGRLSATSARSLPRNMRGLPKGRACHSMKSC